MTDHRHSFRCPVCGHVDEAVAGEAETRTRCTHCATELVLGPEVQGVMGVEVRVAGPVRTRRRGERTTS